MNLSVAVIGDKRGVDSYCYQAAIRYAKPGMVPSDADLELYFEDAFSGDYDRVIWCPGHPLNYLPYYDFVVIPTAGYEPIERLRDFSETSEFYPTFQTNINQAKYYDCFEYWCQMGKMWTEKYPSLILFGVEAFWLSSLGLNPDAYQQLTPNRVELGILKYGMHDNPFDMSGRLTKAGFRAIAEDVDRKLGE